MIAKLATTRFCELGWKHSAQQIALCRGAANMQGLGCNNRLSTYEPPYLGSAQEVYDDMVLKLIVQEQNTL